MTKPSVAGLAATESAFSGFINPNAPKAATELEGGSPEEEAINGAYATHWRFSCEPVQCSFAGSGEGDLKADDTAHHLTATPTGLQANTSYTVILHATNAGGEETEALAAAFTTPAVKPTIERETLWEPTATSIQLNARVNPHNSELTDCHFEYGVDGAFDHSAACEAAVPGEPHSDPSGEGFVTVAARINGLAPATAYKFRLLATNSAGATEEDPLTFTTLRPPAPETCPNEALRRIQHATTLSDCRAYEKVSPDAKGGGDIVADSGTNVAATGGSAVTFNTRTPFGDTVGSGVSGQTTYVARRGPDGWSSHAITPRPRSDAYQTFFGSTRFEAFSEDLRHAVLWAYDLPAASGDVPLRNNIYSEDTESGGLDPVTIARDGFPDPLPHPIAELGSDADWGISADARHVAFVSHVPYLPQAATNGEVFGPPNIYQWDEGVLHLAGILPDGTVPPEGSESVAQETQQPGGARIIYRQAMSADGSRLLFSASLAPAGTAQLLQRVDASRTVWVSEPELDPSAPEYQPEPSGVRLRAAAPDGRSVFFTTDSPLLSGDTNGATDLYRWRDGPNPAGESNLTQISPDGFSGQVIGTSDDGQRLYYQTEGADLALWDRGNTRIISRGLVDIPGPLTERLGVDDSRPGYGRVSPDGRYLAFGTTASNAVPGKYIGPTGRVTNSHREMFLYDAEQDTLRCVSCPAVAATSDATVGPEVTSAVVEYALSGIRPRFLADDGTLFFSTAEALVPADINGVADAYQYDPRRGRLALLSTGRGSEPANFVEADPRGDNVYLVTRQRLTAGDGDDLVDLYDARTDGGLPEPEAIGNPPCQGEGCQPTAATPPAAPQLRSDATTAGNLRARRHHRCAKRSPRSKPRVRPRCKRRPHRDNPQTAKAGR